MKQRVQVFAGFVAVISLVCFVGYRTWFAPAQVPDRLEYLPAGQAAGLELVSSAQAGEETVPPAEVDSDGTQVFDFFGETVGAQPVTFAPTVGNWIIGADGDNKVLVVDGRKWKRGTTSAGIADKARALYGKRYAEFLDNVTAYAYFPFAVANSLDNFSNGDITVRFKAIAGRIDQGAVFCLI